MNNIRIFVDRARKMEPQRALWSVPTCLLILSVRLARPSYLPVEQTCSVGNLAYFEMAGYTLDVLNVSDVYQVERDTPEACQQACREHSAFPCVSCSYNIWTDLCDLYKYRPGEGDSVLRTSWWGGYQYTCYVSYCEQSTDPTGYLIGCYTRDLNVVSPSFSFRSSDQMTPQYCHQYCLYFTQSTYSGVWDGRGCYCGETLASSASSLWCSYPCTGDGTQTCGGRNSIQVYPACDRKKFGANCDQSCNCVDQYICPRTTGACTKPCPTGYEGISCQACPVGKWGARCGSDCSANCKRGTCATDTGKCTQCIEGYSGDTCSDPRSFPSWAIPTILLVVVVLIAAIVIAVLLMRLSSRTKATPSEHPQQGKRESATQGSALRPLGRDANTFKLEQAQVANGAYEGANEEVKNTHRF